MALIKCSPGQQWPGFSFALHRHGAGLLFCPAAIQPHTSVYSAFCAVNAIYHTRHKTAHRALQGLFLRLYPLNRPRYQTDTSGYNTACATLERITAPQHLQHVPDTSTTPDAVQVSTAAYYNKVYKSAGRVRPCYESTPNSAADRRPCKPGGVSMLPTPGGLQSGTGQQSWRTGWHTPPGRSV